jgi:hypothetical protein
MDARRPEWTIHLRPSEGLTFGTKLEISDASVSVPLIPVDEDGWPHVGSPGCCPATECCEEDWPEPLSGTQLCVSGVDPVVVGDQAIAPPPGGQARRAWPS